MIRVNLTGVFLTMRAGARRMIPRGYGKIVSTSSMYGLVADDLFDGAAVRGGEGRRRLADVDGGDRARGPRHPRQLHRPGLAQDGFRRVLRTEDEETMRVKRRVDALIVRRWASSPRQAT